MKKFLVILSIFIFCSTEAAFANAEYRFQLKRLNKATHVQLKEVNKKLQELKTERAYLILDTSVYPAPVRFKKIQKCREEIDYYEQKKEYILKQYKIKKKELKETCK